MADIVSIIKDNAVPISRFLKKQFEIWLEVVSNPLDVISKIDIKSKNSVFPALQFSLFVYVLTIIIAIARLVAYENVDDSNTLLLLSDFVLTFLSFCLIGVTLYLLGKMFGGSGGLLASMVAGFYLTAYWPLVQVTDYFLSPQVPGFDQYETAVLRLIIFVIIFLGIIFIIVYKAHPVMAHVHGFGRIRAIIATLLQVVLVPILIFVFLGQYFLQLTANP